MKRSLSLLAALLIAVSTPLTSFSAEEQGRQARPHGR